MRRMPRLLLVDLVLNALFLGFALWGSRATGPGDATVGAALATLTAIVTVAPLVVALGLWFAGMPRAATVVALLPALALVGYQYLGVLGERQYDRTLTAPTTSPIRERAPSRPRWPTGTTPSCATSRRTERT